MTIKSKIMAAAVTVALAAPLTALPAGAAPNHDRDRGGAMMSGHQMSGHPDAFHDRNHRPALRAERRPPMPHGHYHRRDGGWNWSNGGWVWAPGIWIRF